MHIKDVTLMDEENQYPTIEKEIKKKSKVVPLRYVYEDEAKQIEEDLEKEAELASELGSMPDPYRFAGYNPNVIDFIRRCDTDKEALEIIEFLEKKNDITSEQGDSLRKQLEKDGLRSFGSKKKKGFYFNPDE